MQRADERIIWLLLGRRAGDNAQVLALGEMLRRRLAVRGARARVEEKRLEWTPVRALPNWLLPPTLRVLPSPARAQFAPPWPDVVIGVGRRAVPVARWIQRRNRATKLVWLGRPRAPLKWFDLVLSTAQYGLPRADNVILLDAPPAPLPEMDPAALARWRERFAHLPRPWIAVLVGGARWPLKFDAADAKALGRAVLALRDRTGGSWIVSTSPRTGIRQARALHEALDPPGMFWFWREGSRRENPHRALLALADGFIVTADSASMIAEALNTGKSVWLHELPVQRPFVRWRARGGLMRRLAEWGLLSPPRDMGAFCARLVQQGRARWLREEVAAPAAPPGGALGEAPGGADVAWRNAGFEEALKRIESWLIP